MQFGLVDDQIGKSLTAEPIKNDVKMVIWDLDDTFWSGTLAEGGIEFIESNAETVRALAARGIISSIASKNDPDNAKEVLERAGIWNYFVFPEISYTPKGNTVAEIIRNASLRSENILFIDDNISNLEEVRFFNPGIMLAQPGEIIPGLLDHPRLAGKADPTLKRLKQYQLLQRKFTDQNSTGLSNEDFLRQSQIEIRLDFDVDSNFDRIVDLINRSNQLNYTKKRLATIDDVAKFRSSLDALGVVAGAVWCSDRYGDYGIIGFYMLKKNEKKSELLHFVFSCRTMHMGIEQFVYDHLGRPEITVVGEVAYGLDDKKRSDWISFAKETNERSTLVANDRKLLLVGGCDLQQLASFCSSNRVEFVNRADTRDGFDYIVRYDDPSFFTADRAAVRKNEEMKRLASWTYEDAVLLDQNIASAEIIILAMRSALRHYYVVTKDNIHIRMDTRNINRYRGTQADWFGLNFKVVTIGIRDTLALIRNSFEQVANLSRPDAAVFVVGANSRKLDDYIELGTRLGYNNLCEKFCQENDKKFHFIDVNKVVSESALIDSEHFTRAGYHALSTYIMNTIMKRSAN